MELNKIFLKIIGFLSAKEKARIDFALHQSTPINDTDLDFEYANYFYWENQVYSWDNYPSPIRPSRGDIGIYRNFLKQKTAKKNILILGATPELRDLVAEEAGAKIYVADFSYRMPYAMLKYTKHADPLKERWIKDNWLELPFPQGFFDVILGDLVLQQLPPQIEDAFLKKMRLLLKQDGIFISRFQFLDEEFQKQNIDDIVRKTLNSPLTENQKFILLKLRLIWLFADLASRQLNRRTSAQKFKEFVEKYEIKDPLLERVRDSLTADMNSCRNWSPPEEKELTRIVSEHFIIADRKNSSDYEEARYYPILCLE